jgi:hypothetical protein
MCLWSQEALRIGDASVVPRQDAGNATEALVSRFARL